MNGNGTGPGPGSGSRLLRLLHFHEERAAAIRLVLDMLQDTKQASSTARATQTLQQAIRQDAVRRQTKRGRPQKQKRTWPRGQQLADQRARSAAILAQFDPKEPRPGFTAAGRGLGSLVRRGYLKKKGDGYVRTSQEYVV